MVRIAKGAGFCFGVNRSVEKVEVLLNKGLKVCTLGELIHNRPFCEGLVKRGVRVVEDGRFESVGPDENLVIRSHGAGPEVYRACLAHKIKFVDATCPFVKRIHKIVNLKSKEGRIVLIAGDETHPEVCAIKKYCSSCVFVFSKFDYLWQFLNRNRSKKLVLVAQTTFNSFVWKEGIAKLKNFPGIDLEIYNTICSATEFRQREAVLLAGQVKFMIVIGSRNSSNSRKLFELCSGFCRTLFVERVQDFEKFLKFNSISNEVGICAGASTPSNIIKKVYELASLKLG